jgi:hypothetical protein
MTTYHFYLQIWSRPSCPVKSLLALWLITSAIEQARKNLSLICASVYHSAREFRVPEFSQSLNKVKQTNKYEIYLRFDMKNNCEFLLAFLWWPIIISRNSLLLFFLTKRGKLFLAAINYQWLEAKEICQFSLLLFWHFRNVCEHF